MLHKLHVLAVILVLGLTACGVSTPTPPVDEPTTPPTQPVDPPTQPVDPVDPPEEPTQPIDNDLVFQRLQEKEFNASLNGALPFVVDFNLVGNDAVVGNLLADWFTGQLTIMAPEQGASIVIFSTNDESTEAQAIFALLEDDSLWAMILVPELGGIVTLTEITGSVGLPGPSDDQVNESLTSTAWAWCSSGEIDECGDFPIFESGEQDGAPSFGGDFVMDGELANLICFDVENGQATCTRIINYPGNERFVDFTVTFDFDAEGAIIGEAVEDRTGDLTWIWRSPIQ